MPRQFFGKSIVLGAQCDSNLNLCFDGSAGTCVATTVGAHSAASAASDGDGGIAATDTVDAAGVAGVTSVFLHH